MQRHAHGGLCHPQLVRRRRVPRDAVGAVEVLEQSLEAPPCTLLVRLLPNPGEGVPPCAGESGPLELLLGPARRWAGEAAAAGRSVFLERHESGLASTLAGALAGPLVEQEVPDCRQQIRTEAAGAEARQRSSLADGGWRREDGRWKTVQAHQSFGPIEAAAAEAVPPAPCDAALGAWEYLDPSGPGRATVSKLANGRQLLQWIMVPRGGGPTVAGAWEATCEGARRRWRILFSTNPDGVGSEVTDEFEIEGDTIRFWVLRPDGRRGDEGRARRLK